MQFFDEEEDQLPTRPVPKVTIVSVPGKPRRPEDNINFKLLQSGGGSEDDDDDDNKSKGKEKDKGNGQEESISSDEEKDKGNTPEKSKGYDEEKGKSIAEENGKSDKKQFCNVDGDEDDEELTDPQVKLRECCGKTEECSKLFDELQECNDRVSGKEMTKETCEQELFDFLHCIDHCVVKDLFRYLK